MKEKFEPLLKEEGAAAVLGELGFFNADAVKAKVEEETKGLKANRDEFRVEKDKWKSESDKYKALHEKTIGLLKSHENFVDENGNILFDNIDRVVTAKAPKGGTGGEDVEFLRLQTKRLTEENNKLKTDLETGMTEAETFISNLLIKDEFQRLVSTDSGIEKDLYEFIVGRLMTISESKVVKDEKGNRRAMTESGKSIQDFYADWLNTPEAKALRKAPTNTGGGAAGSQGGSAGKSWKQMTPQERSDLYRKDPELYKKLRDQK